MPKFAIILRESVLTIGVVIIACFAASVAASEAGSSPAGGESGDTNYVEVTDPSEVRIDKENRVDNPGQIDTVQELDQAEKDPGTLSVDDVARELANPNTPLAKLTIENSTTFFDNDITGDDKTEVGNLLLFQPVFPFPLSDDGTTNLFIRPAFTFFTKGPVFDAGDSNFDSESGFGDWGYDVALGRSYDSGVILVGGIQGTIPIGEDNFSGDTWRMGPEAVVAHINKDRAIAVFPQHQWDFAGNGDDFSSTTVQLIYLKFLSDGWVVGSAPELVYDWKENQATVPINMEVRKLVRVGNVPLNLKVKVDYFAFRDDDFGPKFALSFSIEPVVPNFIYNFIAK